MHHETPAPAIGVPGLARRLWSRMRRQRLLNTSRQRLPAAHAAAQDIPPAVKEHWLADALAGSRPENPRAGPDPVHWELAALALSQFFDLCRHQPPGLPLALPSRAADAVWHLWLAHDPQGLAAWQRRWFGGVLPHREAHELGAPLAPSLARTFVAACRSEGRSALAGRLPLLFALDACVAAPGGWHYQRGGQGVFHRDLSGEGRPQRGLQRHPELSAAGLSGLGLLTAAEWQAWRRQQQGGDANVGVFGEGSADGCPDGGSGTGGSGCGSSCGGGGCGS